MILAAHQPQYLPYLGYFHKIAACDLFVWLDDVQYKKREFQNRNRILTPKGEQWLTVAVKTKSRRFQTIREVEIDDAVPWRATHRESLRHNLGKAPGFARHWPFFEEVYAKPWAKLDDLCRATVDRMCREFGIAVPFKNASDFSVKTTSTRRLIDLCQAAGADAYLSGTGGKAYLEENLFEEAGIKLLYQEFRHPEYPQCFPGFTKNLSAVDYLFNEDPAKVSAFFDAVRRPAA